MSAGVCRRYHDSDLVGPLCQSQVVLRRLSDVLRGCPEMLQSYFASLQKGAELLKVVFEQNRYQLLMFKYQIRNNKVSEGRCLSLDLAHGWLTIDVGEAKCNRFTTSSKCANR